MKKMQMNKVKNQGKKENVPERKMSRLRKPLLVREVNGCML